MIQVIGLIMMLSILWAMVGIILVTFDEDVTVLYYINYTLLQFFCVRLCWIMSDDKTIKEGFGVMIGALPCTGWHGKKFHYIIKRYKVIMFIEFKHERSV